MKPLEAPLLADENINSKLIEYLRSRGKDIQSASDLGLLGHHDEELLRAAHDQGRIILTHDSDFGTFPS